ncbi:ABC transporter ATP-binding protein [Propioniciclava sp.]|uniref:ABC transporter ATP-binding protein n=1 Tax=Propioniciclava sp. TaxID=2038686 RepID=UPI0026237F1E|nr:ABC transporter ATP-binding protein [Propioniciclava sp.]
MAIELVGVTKDFTTPRRRHARALDDVFLQVVEASAVALMGPSGSGKSTLLHLVGGLDRPTEGQVLVDGRDVGALKGRALADHRRSVGFVFQRFNLIASLTVLDNVLAPTIGGGDARAARRRALDLLEVVGLAACAGVTPDALSGGEQQRVALARALVNSPRFLLADEPTGALDTATGFEVVDLIGGLREAFGTTVLLATHDYAVAARCERIVTLRDGRIASDRTLGAPAEPRTTAERLGALRPFTD